MAIPAATFDKLKTLAARQSIIAFTPTGGNETILLVDYVGDTGSMDIGRLMAPGAANGPAFTARSWPKSRAEMVRFRCKEIKKIPALLGGLTGHKTGTGAVYLRDPDDAANTVGLMSDAALPCSLYRDPTEIAHSGDNVSEVTLILESHKDGPITWTPDADLSGGA